jgi:hypothetical protein
MNKEILEEFITKAKELGSQGCTDKEDAMLIFAIDNEEVVTPLLRGVALI